MNEDLGSGIDAKAFALGLLEAAPDAILLVKPGGIIGLANRMAERVFGYDRAELIGQPIEMLVPLSKRGGHDAVRSRYERTPRTRAMAERSELDALRKNGEEVPVEISLSPVETAIGRCTIAIIRDVSTRREFETQLRYANTHDGLTGLFNRTYLDEVRAKLESDESPVGVLILDVDGLKAVNDELGHEAGDQLLKRTGIVLRSASGPDDIATRLGGDEFAVVVPRATEQTLHDATSSIQSELVRHNEIHRGPRLELSMGAALSGRRGGIGLAMRLADQRMYMQKRARGSVRVR